MIFFCNADDDITQEIHQRQVTEYQEKHQRLLGKKFAYVFSGSDIKEMQKLMNQLRDIITGTEDLPDDHRQRLLKRLEKLQSELHRRMSNVDAIWGFCLEATMILGKSAQNAQPLANLVKDILSIVYKVQTAQAGLPPGFIMQLPHFTTEQPIEQP